MLRKVSLANLERIISDGDKMDLLILCNKYVYSEIRSYAVKHKLDLDALEELLGALG
jgi:hypothetical protein